MIFTIIFLAFAALSVIMALAAISSKNLIHSSIFLFILMLVFSSIFILIGLSFLGSVELLVYSFFIISNYVHNTDYGSNQKHR